MLEWLIIGGGIQGCTVAAHLVKQKKVAIKDLAIIDPHDEPLALWKRNTGRTGMKYLRSPSVHHIDVSPFSLQKYAKVLPKQSFYGMYKRPELGMFNRHSDNILAEIDIQKAWKQGTVQYVKRIGHHWHVELATGDIIESKRIVVAIGLGEQPSIPEAFADATQNHNENVFHIFAQKIPDLVQLKYPIYIIGGGITASHTAIKLSKMYPGDVHLLIRHPFRIHSFDSDPGWLGPKYLYKYRQTTDYKERRVLIQNARHRGSLPQDVYKHVIKQKELGQLHIVHDEVVQVGEGLTGIQLQLKSEREVEAKTVILATGFKPNLPRQTWLQTLIKEENLQCAHCGYPIVNEGLEWCPHLYVAGALAELELGPVARNIAGARKTAERIVKKA